MITMSGISPATQPTADGKPQNIEQAAGAFEALFLGNLLKAAREARDGSALGEADQAGGSMMDLAEEFLAQEIAKGGGCGLARMVMEQMQQRGAAGQNSDESPVASTQATARQPAQNPVPQPASQPAPLLSPKP